MYLWGILLLINISFANTCYSFSNARIYSGVVKRGFKNADSLKFREKFLKPNYFALNAESSRVKPQIKQVKGISSVIDDNKYYLYMAGSVLFMYLGKYFNLQLPFILQRTIDSISETRKYTIVDSKVTRIIMLSFLQYGIARILNVACSEIKSILYNNVAQKILSSYATKIFNHLHMLDSDFHLQTSGGVLSSSYARAMRGLQNTLFMMVNSIFPTFLELIMASVILYQRFGLQVASITMSTFVLYIFFTVWITHYRIRLRRQFVEIDNQRNGIFVDSLLNHEIVKLFVNLPAEIVRYDQYLQKMRNISHKTTLGIAMLNFGQVVMSTIGLVTSLLFAWHQVNQGKMTIGDVAAINAMLLQLSIPFNYLGYTYQELKQAKVDMDSMRQLLDKPIPTSSIINATNCVSIDTVAPIRGPSTLEFQNVCYHYGNHSTTTATNGGALSMDEMLLKNVSFKIQPGQNIAIVGPSGCGKSTTLKLITKLLSPQSGRILIDNVDIHNVTINSLRSRVSLIPQETYLFDDTILYNIKYGNMSANLEDVNRVIKLSNLEATMKKLPGGLNTVVGTRGTKLSGGERQKVSIARSLIRNPTLLLNDEITSSLDAFSEREIINTLKETKNQNFTTITVAHRLATITHCDVIYVFNHGRIVESGSHFELMNIPNGYYRKMWLVQNEISESEHDLNSFGSKITTTQDDYVQQKQAKIEII